MTTFDLNQIINEITRPEFKPVSKTYLRGVFLNVAFRSVRCTIDLKTSHSDAVRVINELRDEIKKRYAGKSFSE